MISDNLKYVHHNISIYLSAGPWPPTENILHDLNTTQQPTRYTTTKSTLHKVNNTKAAYTLLNNNKTVLQTPA